jgi:hypothetical protein
MSKTSSIDLTVEQDVLLETYEDGTYLLATSLFSIERKMDEPHVLLTITRSYFYPEKDISIPISDEQSDQLRQFYPMYDGC